MKSHPAKTKPLRDGGDLSPFHRGLIGITIIALVLRLWVCWELRDSPAAVNPSPATDMATYRDLALGLLKGRLPDLFYYQPLYYSLFLPPLLFLSYGDPQFVGLIQAFVGAATVWLTGIFGARLFGRNAGLFAAALLAAARFHIFHTPFMLFEVLLGFFIALTLWTTLLAWQRNRLRDWTWAGLSLAAATLTRGNVVLLLPALLALAFWRNRGAGWEPVAARAALLLALFYLPQLPFAIHNAQKLHRWSGPSTAGDAVLALGNTPESPAGGLDYPPAFQEWMRQADLPPETRFPVSRQILAWIRREPLAWAELKFRMVLLFWDRDDIPNNISLLHESRRSRMLGFPVLVDFGVLAMAAVAGLIFMTPRLRRSPPQLFLVYTVLGGACLGTVLFYILGRFRVPWYPVLAVCAGLAMSRILALVSRREKSWAYVRRCGLMLLPFLAGWLFTDLGFTLYSARAEAAVVRQARPHGVQVALADGWLLHDSGPQLLGGWTPVPLPPGGILLRKRFDVPPEAVGKETGAVLELPVFAPTGGALETTATIVGGAPLASTVQLQAGSGAATLRLPLGRIRPGPAVDVELLLVPQVALSAQPPALFADLHRRYDRTRVRPAGAPADAAWADPGAEICAALRLGL